MPDKSTEQRFPSLSHWGAFTAVVKEGRLMACEPFVKDDAPSAILQSMPFMMHSPLRIRKPSAQVEAWLSTQDGANIYFTAVGEAELRHGVAILPAGKRRTALFNAIEGILEEDFRDRILPFDRPAARDYTDIAAEHRAARLLAQSHPWVTRRRKFASGIPSGAREEHVPTNEITFTVFKFMRLHSAISTQPQNGRASTIDAIVESLAS